MPKAILGTHIMQSVIAHDLANRAFYADDVRRIACARTRRGVSMAEVHVFLCAERKAGRLVRIDRGRYALPRIARSVPRIMPKASKPKRPKKRKLVPGKYRDVFN